MMLLRYVWTSQTHALFATAALALATWWSVSSATAQDYPSRPIRVVVPVAPGGLTDILARDISNELSGRLKQAVIVENKPGAGGITGMVYAARLPADGYNLLMAFPGPVVVNPWIYKDLAYDPPKDFVPVHMLARFSQVFAINSNVPAKTLAEFVAYARSNPGKIDYGSGGNTTSSHLFMELFKRVAEIDLVHIPYKGAAPAMTDLVAGRVAAVFDSIALVKPQVEAGKVRALGISSLQRSKLMPDVPTIAEAGVPGFEAVGWFGLMAPSGTPHPVIDRLSREVSAILSDPAVRSRLEGHSVEVLDVGTTGFAELLAADRQRWQRVINDAKITAD